MKSNESPADSAPEAASPFPPAFRWEASTPEAPTHVMGAIGLDAAGDNPAEVTQVLRSPSYQRPDYQLRPDDAHDLFKPVDTPRDEPTCRPSDSSAPPWSDSDIAEQPIAEQQSAWLRQGTEVFQPQATQSRSKQLIGIAVLAVVVLGLMGATVGYFVTNGPGRAGDPQRAAPQPIAVQPTAAPRELPAPPPPLPAPVDTAHALTDPPGQTRGGGGLFDLSQLTSTKLLRPSIVSALQVGGMTDGVLKTTTVGSTTIGMFALTMPDQQAATTVAQTIATTQLDGGLKADDNRALQGMTVMATAPGSPSPAYRAVYVLYNRTIYVEVFGPNRDAVQATFDSLIKQQVTYAPPTVPRVGS